MPAVLELEKIQKKFKDRVVLDSLTLSLAAGEFLCLLGPSGCGKSTLLRIMAGLETPTQGRLSWPQQNKSFGFVFQEAQLLNWRNVFENVRLPLELQDQIPRETQDQKVREVLRKVQLEKAEHLFPHELSGGMKMRVSIARALASSPKILFMDEPFSALDEVTRFNLQTQLRDLCESEKLSVVFVTHSSYEAAFLADRILLMGQEGGRFLLDESVSYPGPRHETLRSLALYQAMCAKISAKMREAFP